MIHYWQLSSAIRDSIYIPKYYNPELAERQAALSGTHTCRTIGELVDAGLLAAETGDEIGKAAYGTGDIPFVRTSDISNWEIKSAPKQGVSREIYEEYSSGQDVQPGDILFVRDGTYLIGTNCFITEIDKEILYQSHVLKLRVHDKEALDPHLLFLALNNPWVQRQIWSVQFHGRHHQHHRSTLLRACSPPAQEQGTTEETDERVHEGPQCEDGGESLRQALPEDDGGGATHR